MPFRTLIVAVLGLLALGRPADALQLGAEARRAITLGQPLTPQMYGAKGDGRADDSASVEAWLAGGRALACSGAFVIRRPIRVALAPDGGLAVQGAGRQLCRFVLAEPDAAIVMDGGTPDIYRTPQVVLHDVGIVPAAILRAPALTIAYHGGSGATDPTVDIRNVAVKPASDRAYAPACLRLDNVRNGVVAAINCEGRRGDYLPGTRGIVIAGDAQPTELTLRDANLYFVEEGVRLEGTWQGVSINETTCVMCRVGVRATASDDNGVWLRIVNSHFNVTDFGVETTNIANVHATGNFVYLNDVGVSRSRFRACVAMTMVSQATAWGKVDGNACDGTQTKATPTYGVYIDSARPPASFLMETRIDGNSFYGLDWGIFLANATSVAIGPNTFLSVRNGEVWNGSSGTGPFESSRSGSAAPLKPGRN